MPRVRYVAVLAAVLALAVAGVASAATAARVTGGTTKVTLSAAALSALTANKITARVVKPAKVTGATVTFPITGGRLNTKTLIGVIRHSGGIAFVKGKNALALLRPTISSTKAGVSLSALVIKGHVRRCHKVHGKRVCKVIVTYTSVRVANVTGVKLSNGKVTGTLKLTAAAAAALNKVAGKKVFAAGVVLGTAVVAPTLK